MHEKVFVENFIVDGIESFEFSKSLQSGVLPKWDLENGFFGFYPDFMLFAYPNSFSMLVYGEGEAAVRLPFFLFLFLTYLVSIKLIHNGRETSAYGLLFLALPFTLLAILQGHYYAWGIETDLAQPAATDLLFLFLFLLSSFHLVNGRYGLFLVASALGVISLPSGRLFFLLSVLAFALSFTPGKRTVLKLAASSVATLLGTEVLYRIYVSYVPQGEIKFDAGFVLREYLTGIGAENLLWDLKTLAIVTGIVPLLACCLIVRDRVSRYFTYILFAYFAVVIVIPQEKLHYFMPLSVGVLIVATRKVSGQAEPLKRAYYALSTMSFLALIVACYPKSYEPYTLAGDFGARSCISVPSYEEAVRYLRPFYDTLPLFKHGINPHSWIHYSDLTHCPKEQYDFYFTVREMPLDGYTLHRLDNGSYFYAREGALRD
jgi:hypothetical protein